MIVAALMILVVVLRIFPGWFYLVLPDREPRLPDPDAYYHFRQAAYTLQHFPQLLRWDDLSFYPAVLRNDAAGLYDLTLAGLAKVVAAFGLPPLRALWWVCLWFPPLAVAAILPFVYLLVRRSATVGIGLLMALWYLLLPGATLSHMTLGVCDHHVVEMLISVLSIFLLQRLVTREREQPSAWWKPAWGAALPVVILQFTWLGGPLFLPIFGLAGLGQLAADILAGVGARPLVRAGLRYWLAFFLLSGATGLLCPSLILLPGLWMATLAGAGTVLVALAAAGWFFATPRLLYRPGERLALGAGVLVALTGLVLVLSPTARGLLAAGLSHKSTLVAENQPVTPRFYWTVTGLAGVLGLFAPVAGVLAGAWRRPAWWIAVLPSLFFLALWWRTYDYVYQGALHAILLTGYFFGAAVNPPTPGGNRARWWGGPKALAACTALVILGVWPAGSTVPWWMPGSWYRDEAEIPSDGWIAAMRWLRLATPQPPPLPPQPPADRPPRGRVGVMTDWSTGQFVNTLALRPATSSRYPEAEGIAPFFLRNEDEVRAAPLRGFTVATAVRYIALEPKIIGDYCGAHLSTIGLRLEDYYGRGTFVDGRHHTMSVPTLGPLYDQAFATRLLLHDGDGFAHFRLIFESREQSFLRMTYDANGRHLMAHASLLRTAEDLAVAREDLRRGLWKEGEADAYLGHVLAAVKIFEQVEGAKIAGTAPAGSTVTLEIPLRLRSSGRTWQYHQSVTTNAAGRFKLVVPYATEIAAGTDLIPIGRAALFLGPGAPTTQRNLSIPEAAVQSGAEVAWAGHLESSP